MRPADHAAFRISLTPPGRTAMSLPIVRHFPPLGALPRARLADIPSPVEKVEGIAGVKRLWLKRDDLDAPVTGGNKVRALEWLLGDARAGDTLVVPGGVASTHVLATAVHGARLGCRTIAVRWPHEMAPATRHTVEEIDRVVLRTVRAWNFVDGVARARLLAAWLGARHVPFGGSTPLGILGHVNAALELVEQVEAGLLPMPERVVVPCGSAGTAAGLLLGFAIARAPVTVVAARVGPAIGVNARRVFSLAHATARFITRTTGMTPVLPWIDALEMAHEAYGGAYGRPSPEGTAAATALRARCGLALDATYSAKAAAVALARGEGTLLWVTYDGRALAAGS